MVAAPLGRSIEETNLLNPAFLARVLHAAAAGHREVSARGLPWALAFLAVPVVLHPPLRDALPSRATSRMALWVLEHPELVAVTPPRARAFLPFVREALLFGARYEILAVDGSSIEPLRRRPLRRRFPDSEDVAACLERSTFFGRWTARSGSQATILALWGLTV